MQSIKEKIKMSVVDKMTKEFGYKTPMAVPHILKVVINSGVGKLREKKDAVEILIKHLTLITGQKPMERPAKKAIASFKSREGMIIGYKVTLRGARMYDFLDRLVNFTIPRMRDFRGIPVRSIDQGGSLTLGIKEHIIFPEMIGEDVRSIFGLEITIVTNAKEKKEATQLFRLLGFPFEK
jgi:large subunit ribosomal protein L5